MRRRFLLALLAATLLAEVYVGGAFLKARRLASDIPLLGSDLTIRGKLKLTQWVPLARVSRAAVDAIVASEDDDFYHHQGIELSSIKDALATDLRHLRFKRGASTITQQVVKNVFLNREKSLRRKIEEALLARKAEEAFDKDRILEVYLNTAQFGESLYGIGPASAFYFHKPPSELGPKEGAFLAMLLPSPVRYSQSFADRRLTPYAEKTIRTVLERMRDEGSLTPEQCAGEGAARLSFEAAPAGPVPGATGIPTPVPTVPPTSPEPVPPAPVETQRPVPSAGS